MLLPEQVDLSDLALALEDHTAGHRWWLEPATGRVEPRFDDPLQDPGGPHPGGLIPIEPLPTPVGYRDMEEFVDRVRDPRVRDELERAISGRRAFRRFKDALLDHPRLRRAWFVFHDARSERRAIEWLVEQGLCDRESAERELARRPEPSPEDLPGVLDAQGVARQVAQDLRRLYRRRLTSIVLTGAWARDGAHPESEISLIVILTGAVNRWEEKRRMDRVMWRHSMRHDTVVTVLPLREDVDLPFSPLVARALEEGVPIE